jgi:hypothetical protein
MRDDRRGIGVPARPRHGRTRLPRGRGEIAVAVRFETADAAKAAFEVFAGHPDAKAFESKLDPSAVTISHWSVAKSW